MKNKLIIASQNKHKIKEITDMLADKYDVLSASDIGFVDDIKETGSTFLENSYIKAKAVYDFCHLPSLADDSGLNVDSLNGEPGVYSARYAGEHGDDNKNIDLLLKNLKDKDDRKAHFTTCMTLIDGNKIVVGIGQTDGEILFERKGTNGFGYDPVFYSYDLKKSFGEATSEEKNAVSHRYRALLDLKSKL